MKKLTERLPLGNVSIESVMKFVYATIGNTKKEGKTQDPDAINLHKQWNEFVIFKGYWVDVIYTGKRGYADLVISFDTTAYYTRILGSPNLIPLYTAGKHNYPETKRVKQPI